MNVIAANIRSRRAALGLRQAQVAEAAGFSQRLVSKLEGKSSNPRAQELAHIARALNTTASELLAGYTQDAQESAEIEQAAPAPAAPAEKAPGKATQSKPKRSRSLTKATLAPAA